MHQPPSQNGLLNRGQPLQTAYQLHPQENSTHPSHPTQTPPQRYTGHDPPIPPQRYTENTPINPLQHYSRQPQQQCQSHLPQNPHLGYPFQSPQISTPSSSLPFSHNHFQPPQNTLPCQHPPMFQTPSQSPSVRTEIQRLFSSAVSNSGTSKRKLKNQGRGKKQMKDLILLDYDVTTVPKGLDRQNLHRSGQYVTGFTFGTLETEEMMEDRIEAVFPILKDLTPPRFEHVKCFNSEVFPPTVDRAFKWDGTGIKFVAGQGSIYIRAMSQLPHQNDDDLEENTVKSNINTVPSDPVVLPTTLPLNICQYETRQAASLPIVQSATPPAILPTSQSEGTLTVLDTTCNMSAVDDLNIEGTAIHSAMDSSEDDDLKQALAHSLEDEIDDACSSNYILKVLQKQVSDEKQKINVCRQDIWSGFVRATKRSSFCPYRVPDVCFTDDVGVSEGAVDLGGPRREFFELVLQYITKKFFLKVKNGMTLKNSTVISSEYMAAGVAIGMSLLHDGPKPLFFSEVFYDTLSREWTKRKSLKVGAIKPEDVGEEEDRQYLKLLEEAKTLQDTDDPIEKLSTQMRLAGLGSTVIQSMEDIPNVINRMCWWLEVSNKANAVTEFSNGLEKCGIIFKLKSKSIIMKEFFCGSPIPFTSTSFELIFTITRSDIASNRFSVENQVLLYWKDMLCDIEENDAVLEDWPERIITFEDILFFST